MLDNTFFYNINKSSQTHIIFYYYVLSIQCKRIEYSTSHLKAKCLNYSTITMIYITPFLDINDILRIDNNKFRNLKMNK